jgi:cysteine desulfurase
MDPRVIEAMLPWLATPANAHAIAHRLGRSAAYAVEEARERVAAVMRCKPEEIAFTSGATEASNIVLSGLLSPGDRLVISAIEHPSVADAARALSARGVAIAVVGVDSDGILDVDALEEALAQGARLASIMQVNNEIGTIQPIAEVALSCSAASTALHCDMTQGLGRVPSPIADSPVSYASVSSHKIHGPQGIGALYVRRGAETPRPLTHGGGQEKGLRPGTLPVAACVGFGVACELAEAEADADREHAQALSRTMLSGLSRIDGWQVNGALDARVPHNLSIAFADVDADALISVLPQLALSTGSACSSRAIGRSATLAAIGLDEETAAGTIRLGFGRTTTERQGADAAALIVEAVERLRGGAR